MLKLSVATNLYLRSFVLEDVVELTECIQANTDHLQKWISWIHPNSNQEQIIAFIYQQIQNIEHQNGFMLGLFLDEICIGMAGLQNWDHQLSMAEIGFWISKSQTKNGLMRKSLNKLIEFGFSEMQLLRITATFPMSNNNAHRILDKLGFKMEGILRNHILHQGLKSNMAIMGLLKPEWNK